MNEQPTPETDIEHLQFAMGGFTLDFCRKLERERDEAHKELSSIHRWIERNHADGFIDSLTYFQNLERVTDSWYDRIGAIESDARRFVRERDEAREVASGLAKQAERICKERDEARNKMADAIQEVDLRTLDYLRLREAIIATLEENRHLADGDDCTLAKLKSVVPEWK